MTKRPNLIIIGLVCLFVATEILILRPTNLETGEQATTGMFNSIEKMVQSQKQDDEVGYTIDGFHYTAVEGEAKHWELDATQAILYEKSRLVKSTDARIKMFDDGGQITFIEGDYADYRMGEKDLVLTGNVKVTFPDGFWIKTHKAYYSAKTGMISSDESFYGESATPQPAATPRPAIIRPVKATQDEMTPTAKPASEVPDENRDLPKKAEQMQMWGVGFDANKFGPDINIHSKAHVRVRRLDNDEISDVRSDRSRVNRFTKLAYFFMNSSISFVESFQGTLHIRSKRQELTYDSMTKLVSYMTANEDVLIKETDQLKVSSGLKYATSQKAEFLTKENKILLSGFPSAYQEHDTLTGELIIIYRDKNLVEVTHANAFHDGNQVQGQQQQQRRNRTF